MKGGRNERDSIISMISMLAVVPCTVYIVQETNLKEVNTNYVALRRNHLELTEYKCMLKQAEIFLSEANMQFNETDETTSKCFLLLFFHHKLRLGLWLRMLHNKKGSTINPELGFV